MEKMARVDGRNDKFTFNTETKVNIDLQVAKNETPLKLQNTSTTCEHAVSNNGLRACKCERGK